MVQVCLFIYVPSSRLSVVLQKETLTHFTSRKPTAVLDPKKQGLTLQQMDTDYYTAAPRSGFTLS